MVVLHYFNDMSFTGSVLLFYVTQLFYIPAVGVLSLLFGWTAANPGVAASRMILFIPGGFIFGGATGPIAEQAGWVQTLTHVFPLRWEYEFIRDIMLRGADYHGISHELGAFLVYFGILLVIFCCYFYHARKKLLQAQAVHSA
jgi:ABC-2 type transport system permease protein